MQYIADLHIHSHYSIATSKASDPENIFLAAATKGVNLVGTGDFTHPGWRQELLEKLEPDEGTGFWRLRPELEKALREKLPGQSRNLSVRFVLSGELSSIYKKMGRARKVHNLILMPDMESVDRLCADLEKIGNIRSDGRPILGLDCRDLLEMTIEACPEACFIPAHIWTPHFSVFGSKSGFDRIEDCYGDLTGEIHAVETGLSSDPPMNWRVSALDRYILVSNSDAHSPEKLAREANLIDSDFSYRGLTESLKGGESSRFLGTVEFYPEEGKYHYDGHRACKVRLTPEQTAGLGGRCPVCGGKITEGVLSRVVELADRPTGTTPDGEVARHFERLIPLIEVLAESHGVGSATRAVLRSRERLLREIGPELFILRKAPIEAIARVAGPTVAEAVLRNRTGKVRIEPGYDGEYGTVRIFEPGERETSTGQMFFFEELKTPKKEPESLPVYWKKPAESAAQAAGSGVQGSAQETITETPSHIRVPGLDIELNRRQLEAATHDNGPLAVIAGPGTGKTRCLAARAGYLVRSCGVSPGKILAVTFTNRAAREMRGRIGMLLAGGADEGTEVTVSTFHGFCLDFLTLTRGFSPLIADETDRLSLLREALTQAEGNFRIREISEAIGRAKALGQTPENYCGPEAVRRAYSAYRDLCKKLGVCDYDDLILEALYELRSSQHKQSNLRGKYPYLLVDEFQDLNPVQYELLKIMAGNRAEGLFVIGDPYQSIYGFRGADGRVFERLKEDFPHLCQINLELGYRCSQIIAQASASLLTGGSAGVLAPRAINPGGIPLKTIRCPGERAESIAIVREIGRLVGGIGMLEAHGEYRPRGREELDTLFSFADCAVIARTGALCENLETAFVTEGIPYRLRGSNSFLQNPMIRQAVSYLRLLANPADDLRFLDALRFAGLDPGDSYFSVLRKTASHAGRSLMSQLKRSLSHEVPLKPESGPAAEFLLKFDKFRRQASLPPAELLKTLIADFVGEPPAISDPLAILLTTAEQFSDLGEFLARLVIQTEGDIERAGRTSSGIQSEAVTILTMHAAKGLEFKVIFICGVEEGIIPFTYRETDPEEERRLFYVALTRASQRVYLTSAARRKVRGRLVQATWSPLVNELPSSTLEEIESSLPPRSSDRQLDLL